MEPPRNAAYIEKMKLLNRKRRKGFPKRMFALRKHRHIKRWLLRNPWMRPMTVFNMASIKIQSVMRSYLCRKRLRNPAATRSTKKSLASAANQATASKKSTHRQLDRYLSKLEYYNRRPLIKPSWIEGGFSSWCAVRIQAWFRMTRYYRRYNYKNRITNQIASLVIQSAFRNTVFRRIKKKLLVNLSAQRNTRSEYDCALCIQLMWRSFCNVRVYRYFRDLILHKLTGAPSELLRTVIPNESSLLERAAGTHVRFRLAGVSFPPKIVFKIYTHRPLCDVNAFAPRNYQQERELTTYERFNKSDHQPRAIGPTASTISTSLNKSKMRVGSRYFDTVVNTAVPMDQWYQREERNNWRPISSQLLLDIYTPQWAINQAQQQLYLGHHTTHRSYKHFHYSQLQRKEDLLKHKKRRRREWMVKAYLLGNLGNVTSSANANTSEDRGSDVEEDYDSFQQQTENTYRNNATNNNKQQLNIRQSQIIDWVHKMEHIKDMSKLNQQQRQQQHTYYMQDTSSSYSTVGNKQSNYSLNKDRDDILTELPKLEADTSSNEELLKWSSCLDFDEYATMWSSMAVSVDRPRK